MALKIDDLSEEGNKTAMTNRLPQTGRCTSVNGGCSDLAARAETQHILFQDASFVQMKSQDSQQLRMLLLLLCVRSLPGDVGEYAGDVGE